MVVVSVAASAAVERAGLEVEVSAVMCVCSTTVWTLRCLRAAAHRRDRTAAYRTPPSGLFHLVLGVNRWAYSGLHDTSRLLRGRVPTLSGGTQGPVDPPGPTCCQQSPGQALERLSDSTTQLTSACVLLGLHRAGYLDKNFHPALSDSRQSGELYESVSCLRDLVGKHKNDRSGHLRWFIGIRHRSRSVPGTRRATVTTHCT